MSNVLVLEDDFLSRHPFFYEFLKEHNVLICTTSDWAIELLQRFHFDCVFLDHDLGRKIYQPSDEKSGFWVAKWLSEHYSESPGDLPQVIVHSKNENGSKNILSVLPEARWIPFDLLVLSYTQFGDMKTIQPAPAFSEIRDRVDENYGEDFKLGEDR